MCVVDIYLACFRILNKTQADYFVLFSVKDLVSEIDVLNAKRNLLIRTRTYMNCKQMHWCY